MKMVILIVSVYPDKVICFYKPDALSRLNDEAVQILRSAPDVLKQRAYLQATVVELPVMKTLFRVAHRVPESRLVKWFQQIIERVQFEGPNRILLIGCRKDDLWQSLDADRFNY